MTEPLADDYPETAPYIQRAVDEHGEDWMVEHYYEHLYPLARVMAIPERTNMTQ